MTPKIDNDGMVYSPCGSLRFFYDDYDPSPTFYSSVNTGLCISDGKGDTIVDFHQADWNAPYPPDFPENGVAVVEVSRSGGRKFVLAIDVERQRYCFRPLTDSQIPHIPTDATDWRSGLTDIEPAMRAAAEA